MTEFINKIFRYNHWSGIAFNYKKIEFLPEYQNNVSKKVIQRSCIFFQCLLMLFSHSLTGQTVEKKIINQAFSLFSYTNNVEISPKLSIINDVQERNFIKPIKQSQFFLRSQIAYRFRPKWSASAGFAYSLNSPADPSSSSSLIVPEIRLNQDINYRQKIKTFSIGHRYRMEERFISKSIKDSLINGYTFRKRVSYSLSFEYPLIKPKDNNHSLSFRVSNAIMVNVKKRPVSSSFDQNRFYAGFNYEIIKNVNLELGYVNIFQQRILNDHYFNRNMASLAVNHRMKLKN